MNGKFRLEGGGGVAGGNDKRELDFRIVHNSFRYCGKYKVNVKNKVLEYL